MRQITDERLKELRDSHSRWAEYYRAKPLNPFPDVKRHEDHVHLFDELLALRLSNAELVAALNEAFALLAIARSALYKLGLAGRGSDALPHETRMFALHFSPAEELQLPFGTKTTGDGRLSAFWKMGSAAIEASQVKP